MAEDEKGLLAGLGNLLKSFWEDVKRLGKVIDNLWNAYGRFATLMNEIEKDNLAGRANQLLNQAQTILNQSEQSIADLDVAVQTAKRLPAQLKKDLTSGQSVKDVGTGAVKAGKAVVTGAGAVAKEAKALANWKKETASHFNKMMPAWLKAAMPGAFQRLPGFTPASKPSGGFRGSGRAGGTGVPREGKAKPERTPH